MAPEIPGYSVSGVSVPSLSSISWLHFMKLWTPRKSAYLTSLIDGRRKGDDEL
jgi:hypothetical protein